MSDAQDETKIRKSELSVYSIIGYVCGVLSFLNLIDDLSFVRLAGRIDQWVSAYARFVDKLFSFLFGWLDFWWISISKQESHLIVMAFLVNSSATRAFSEIARKKFEDSVFIAKLVFFFLLSLLTIFPILVMSLIFPAEVGFWISATYFVILFTHHMVMIPDGKMENVPSSKYIRREAMVVVVATLLIVLINEIYFTSRNVSP